MNMQADLVLLPLAVEVHHCLVVMVLSLLIRGGKVRYFQLYELRGVLKAQYFQVVH